MESAEKIAAKQFNDQLRAGATFLYNAALASFAAGFGLWYTDTRNSHWILAGVLGGIVFAGFAIALLQEMRAEE